MNYTQLTREERYQIYALKKAGHKQYEIAELLERSKSTISRELARNHVGSGYRSKQAHRMAKERRAMNARMIDAATWQFVQDRLLEQWIGVRLGWDRFISNSFSTTTSTKTPRNMDIWALGAVYKF